jgi:hypothetical protein
MAFEAQAGQSTSELHLKNAAAADRFPILQRSAWTKSLYKKGILDS